MLLSTIDRGCLEEGDDLVAKEAGTPQEAGRGLHREQRKPHHAPRGGEKANPTSPHLRRGGVLVLASEAGDGEETAENRVRKAPESGIDCGRNRRSRRPELGGDRFLSSLSPSFLLFFIFCRGELRG